MRNGSLSNAIFFLDKAKALPIRIVSQTAWQTIRSDFIDNEEKLIAKDYTIGVISCDDCTIHGNLTYSQLPKCVVHAFYFSQGKDRHIFQL